MIIRAIAVLAAGWLSAQSIGGGVPEQAASDPAGSPQRAAAQTQPVKTPPAEPNPTPAPAAEAKPPADAQEPSTPREVSAEEVLREFQKERPKAEPLLPRARTGEAAAEPTGTAGGSGRDRLPEGYILVDRGGRLTRDGSWWVYAFTRDNNPATSPEPPVKLLPNQMLERMVRETESGTASVDFIISGEITNFMGDNYLLVRKLMRKRDMGNLSR